MIGKFFVLALCGVAFTRAAVAFQGFALSGGNDLEETCTEEDMVRKLANETLKKVQEVEVKLVFTSQDFDEIRRVVEDSVRFDMYDLMYKLSDTAGDAMSRMVYEGKPFSVFECVMTAEEETVRKLHTILDKTKQSFKQIQEKSLSQVRVFESSIKYLRLYVKDLVVKKILELSKTSNKTRRKQIVKEVENRTDYINLTLYQIKDRLKMVTDKLSSDFYKSGNFGDMNKSAKDGSEKINKCLLK